MNFTTLPGFRFLSLQVDCTDGIRELRRLTERGVLGTDTFFGLAAGYCLMHIGKRDR